ncbi:MAG: YifB family Mg chelatase-like AAA ATPase [Gammaproteobacteria bacterium]|nr:YifB family Mg chelatase-like AAA ATPase [Gammaproteobacteria bacterium]
MAFARVLSRGQQGLDAPLVQVEVHLAAGLPGFTLVGLPAPVVRESRERARAALQSSGYDFPPGRITVNLAPVELEKEGGRFDLPIALGLLLASGQLQSRRPGPFECYGELSLAGDLKPVHGLLPAAMRAAAAGHELFLPADTLGDVRLAAHPAVHGGHTLREICALIATRGPLGAAAPAPVTLTAVEALAGGARGSAPQGAAPSLDDVAGQWQAKRALAIAAAGGHSLLMIGPPGSGKSLLAARLPDLLPDLTTEEALEVAGIAAIAAPGVAPVAARQPPFRAPHHTASAHAIVGGGPHLRPGEISLAHRGVLFLDELPEFDRRVLESLREPLESGAITLARASARIELPAAFQLMAAMNPCPCGYHGDEERECCCRPRHIARYRGRISGPLLDRIDLVIEVPRVAMAELLPGAAPVAATAATPPGLTPASGAAAASAGRPPMSAAALRAQVIAARERQQRRAGSLNARLGVAELATHCALDAAGTRLLAMGAEKLRLSGRGLHRVLRVARTIADLEGYETIATAHLAEALQLRRTPDRQMR